MQISVIILNYNVRYFLEQCVWSVQKALQDIDSEIIVIDNASSDDSCAMIKEKFPNIVLIENSENLGFPKGNNIGVAQAKGEYICILNPDTIVAEDTFYKLLKFVESRKAKSENLGGIGVRLIDGSGHFLPESKRGVPTPWVAFTKIFGLYKIFPKSTLFNRYYAMQLNENESGNVDILVGAFMFMKRDLYLELGGFDENCFMYSDDIDLSYMMLKSGRKNYYFADTTVIHYKGESTVRNQKYMERFREAMQFFYKKHFKKSVVFDVFMSTGAFLFSIVKKNQQRQIQRKADKIQYITAENQLEKHPKPENHTEYIFDTDSLSFSEIIALMEQYKAPNITFKNYISQSNYRIGSNNANDRGTVEFGTVTN